MAALTSGAICCRPRSRKQRFGRRTEPTRWGTLRFHLGCVTRLAMPLTVARGALRARGNVSLNGELPTGSAWRVGLALAADSALAAGLLVRRSQYRPD